ncbi:MAG: sigma-70 family RNA polymerase sigma factor [Clostridia bacterium]|nr:sigma-70 family RNA polymerase sigma factor [Clostridia bacterium]
MIFFVLTESLPEKERDIANRIFERYSGKIYAIALSILKNKEDAEDALCETAIKIVKNIKNFGDIDGCVTKALIVIYTRSAALDIYRQNKRERDRTTPLTFTNDEGELEDVEIPDAQSAEDATLAKERARDVRAALEALTPRQKEVIRLVFGAGHTHKEAANILGVSENAVSLLIIRAREKLKTVLGDKLDEYLGK